MEAIMSDFTRFDIPESVSNLIERAIEIKLIDHKDIITLSINHGTDWKAFADTILEYAYANIHVNNDHAIIAPLHENVMMDIIGPPDPELVIHEVTDNDKFNYNFSVFLEGVTKIYTDYMKKEFPNNPIDSIGYKKGRRYIKVTRGGSVHCFVDTTNGDVLKAASWRAPAKHARGNIYDNDYGLTNMTPYGTMNFR
jgi:hypothetical protein